MRGVKTAIEPDLLVLVTEPLRRHRCRAERVLLERLPAERARVLYADRCDEDPGAGCDGITLLRPGELVRIPRVPWPETLSAAHLLPARSA